MSAERCRAITNGHCRNRSESPQCVSSTISRLGTRSEWPACGLHPQHGRAALDVSYGPILISDLAEPTIASLL